MADNDPRSLLRALEQRARKRFGQHFLTDVGVVERIVLAARVVPGDRVVEIGPGLGILTEGLLAAGADLTAIELDRDLAGFLRERFPELHLIEGDAERIDWPATCPGSGWKVVANLPYNVGTHVTMELVRLPATFASITVMLQREVVDRLCANPGTKAYGALSVEVQARARPSVHLHVPPHVFHPKPKVDSAVVRLDLRQAPEVAGVDPTHFDMVVRASFAHRRKTLLNSLSARFGREESAAGLERAGVDPSLRAERLDLAQFGALARAFSGVTG